jgi:hypothetical protein
MHFAGMLGMPRRIYTYDAGQGWEVFNMMSTIGAFLLAPATLLFIYNFFKSKTSGEVCGPNPWDGATLEWSIPSPPPEYNFAKIPMVSSRYPLWDLTHPERTSEIPHTQAGWEEATRQTGEHDMAPMHIETERRTAKELGIPMPTPTIKPFWVALGIVLMFSGLLFLPKGMKVPAFTLMFGGAAMWIGFLYAWLLTPLEEHH